MSCSEEDFCAWLGQKLAELNLGDETYVQYVKDIVAMDSSVSDDAEKEESLKEFLAEATGSDVDSTVKEIMEYWKSSYSIQQQQSANAAPTTSLEEIARSILDKPTSETTHASSHQLDARVKAAVLSHCSYEDEGEDNGSDESSDDEQKDGEGRPRKPPSDRQQRQARKNASAADIAATFENTNSKRVVDAQKGHRETSKAESAARAARDKAALAADRESKAKKKEERKKHAQKQERRS